MSKNKTYKGLVKRNPDGFGFFVCENQEIEDLYIPKEEMVGVFSNDRVEVQVLRRRGPFGRRGKMVKILERSKKRYVGRIRYGSKTKEFYLRDTSHSWGQKLIVKNAIKAEPGELVLVEVTKFPKLGQSKNFFSKAISSLGSEQDPNTDNIRILHESSVPVSFSEKALKQARKFGAEVLEKDKKERVDLRKVPLVTIDGVTAKDFDDAIFVEKKLRGGYKLIVAIADVSHYVKHRTLLDKEAYEKGTSVYLANYVCPMLPEELSNGLCSLNPLVDRLCFCCEMHFGPKGQIKSYDFFEGVMNSHARLTYGEVQSFLETGELTASGKACSKKVVQNVKAASELAEVLKSKRFKEGSIDFDVPATKVLVDDTGEPTDLVKEDRVFAHRMIEELMLVTNICASLFLEKKKRGQLYRVHESPDGEDLKKLSSMLGSFLNTKIKPIKSSFDFQKISKLLSELETPSLASIAQGFALRSMKQAQYSSSNVGHYGLNFTHYAHFTSPIRRYPDLVIHRQIKSALKKTKPYNEEELAEMGTILSAAEQRAVRAERKVTSIKKARFFEKFLGREFEGYISSVAKFGAFVTLREYPLDGLVKLEDLSSQRLIYDEANWALLSKRTGKAFRVGDQVRVQVSAVHVQEGKIDFILLKHKGGEHSERYDLKSRSKKKPSNSTKQKASRKSGSKTKSKKGIASLFSSSLKSRGLSFSKKGKKKKR